MDALKLQFSVSGHHFNFRHHFWKLLVINMGKIQSQQHAKNELFEKIYQQYKAIPV